MSDLVSFFLNQWQGMLAGIIVSVASGAILFSLQRCLNRRQPAIDSVRVLTANLDEPKMSLAATVHNASESTMKPVSLEIGLADGRRLEKTVAGSKTLMPGTATEVATNFSCEPKHVKWIWVWTPEGKRYRYKKKWPFREYE